MRLLTQWSNSIFPLTVVAILALFPLFAYVTETYLGIRPTYAFCYLCVAIIFGVIIEIN